MPELHFPAGFQIGEHKEYTIIRSVPLSQDVRNSFAEVYLAVKPKTRKKFAVKILRPSVIRKFDRIIDDFQREIKLLMNLNHRYIIKIEDFGTVTDAEGVPSFYLTNEYVPSGQLLGRDYQIKQIFQLGIQMCEGLRYLHSKGVIHRDIKPDNILLSEGKIVKIMDFGIAKILGEGDPVSSVIGAPAYAAPEQIHHIGPVTERSDIYALGKTLYSMAAHKVPQPDGQITGWGPELIEESRSESLMDVIRTATCVNPEERFDNMEEFKIALSAARKRTDKKRKPDIARLDFDEELADSRETELKKTILVRSEGIFKSRKLIIIMMLSGMLLAIIGLYDSQNWTNIFRNNAGKEIETSAARESQQLFLNALRLYEIGPQFYQEAQQIFEEMVTRFPEDGRPFPYLGWIYIFSGMPDAALAAWQKAVLFYPKQHVYRISLGLAYFQLGRRAEAVGEWKKVLTENPGASQAKALLEIANRSQ